MTDARLIASTATELVTLLRRREVSPLELIDVAERRIAAVDGAVNALPTRCFDRARQQAKAMMASGAAVGPLAGLPVIVKDNNDVGGVLTTGGSPIFADRIAETSEPMVATLEANGGIPIAKSNIPEFAGANTFNAVFGATRNPWDLRLSVAGSSGGSAAALASGTAWLATGNDLGGSLRTPASFCSVVGVRPSPGRVPRNSPLPFDPLWVEGPMARNVADAALMLDAMCAQTPRDPISFPPPQTPFATAVRSPVAPGRVAFSPDLGIVPVAPEVREVCAGAMRHFAAIGAEVEQACPDFSGAIETFQTLRATLIAVALGHLLATDRHRIKPDIVWNIEKGLRQSADETIRAEHERGLLYRRVAAFFEDYDLLVCPAAPVTPFPVETNFPTEIDGQRLKTYIDWIGITFAVTLTSCPVVALPCGFTSTGLPVGLQLIGRPRGEAALLAAARLFEEAAGIAASLPIDPRPNGAA